jgi:predicted cobalt transporter CbtA
VLRSLLICGLLAGLCAGVLATGFAELVGEPQVNRAIAFEDVHEHAHGRGAANDAPVVSRAMQRSFGLLSAAVIYGLALGCLFALAFAVVYGRVGRASPARTSVWLALAAFVTVFLVPFVKYPANPPAVGDADTIGKRTAVYVTMIAISLLAGVAAVRLRGALRERHTEQTSILLAAALYLGVVVTAGLALPSASEVPADFPADTLFRFREASVGMQAVLWSTIGLVFAATSQRVMTGQTMLPRRPARAAVEEPS